MYKLAIMNKSKLTNTAKMFVRKTDEHCLVLTLNREGTSLEGVGDDAWVNVLQEKPELLESLTPPRPHNHHTTTTPSPHHHTIFKAT